MRSFFFVVALVSLDAQHAFAEDRSRRVTVKRQLDEMIGVSTFWITGPNCTVTSRPASSFPPRVLANPAELAQTVNPVHARPCPLRVSAFGAEFDFSLQFDSLRDVGTWVITCNGGLVPQAECRPSAEDSCGYSCRTAAITPWGAPVRYTIDVRNEPPTASISHEGSTGMRADGTLAFNALLQLHANARDADEPSRGVASYQWTAHGPAGARATLIGANTANPRIQFGGEADFGAWRFGLDVTDHQGERVHFDSATYSVTNAAPPITITAPPNVRVGQMLELSATTHDDDGGMLTNYRWRVQRPGMPTWESLPTPVTPHLLRMTVRPSGTWRFQVDADDNDRPPLTGHAEREIVVTNQRPVVRIFAAGGNVIHPGEELRLGSMASDPDGMIASYAWELLQVPERAGHLPSMMAGTHDTLRIPTPRGVSHAGTWVFRLRVTDNEGESSTSDAVAILVDAPPEVSIDAPSGPLGPGAFTLQGHTEDPDSRCEMSPTRCHLVAPGHVLVRSDPPLRSRAWQVEAVPTEHLTRHPRGPVEEAFHTAGSLDTLHFEPGQISAGVYRFRLDAEDAEGGRSSARVTVTVRPQPTAPVVNLSAPQRAQVNALGALTRDIVIDARASFDPDDFIGGGMSTPLLGIARIQWHATAPTPSCHVPELTDGGVLTLFAASTAIPTECLGEWRITATATDTDTPAQSGSDSTTVIIGTCAGQICIDSPRAAAPHVMTPGAARTVPIFYHVDPSVYSHPALAYGFYAQIEILRTGTSEVIYSAYDPTPAFAAPGEILRFSWNGNRADRTPAPSGTYDVRISLTDSGFVPQFTTTERLAILVETVEVSFTAPARHLRQPALEDGSIVAAYYYRVTGALGVTAFRHVVRNASGGEAFLEYVPARGTSGGFTWNGHTGSALQPPGDYEVEVTAFRDAAALHTVTVPLTLYRIRVGASLGRDDDVALYVPLNTDDDDLNGRADTVDAPNLAENDLGRLSIVIEPPSLAGTVALSYGIAGAGAVSFFETAKKERPVTLPWTVARAAGVSLPDVFVEGVHAGRGLVQVVLTPAGAAALPPEPARVNVTGLEIIADTGALGIDAADGPAPALRPGLWPGAHTNDPASMPPFHIANDAAGSFVELDQSHFYLRVHDDAANLNRTGVDTVTARVGTLLEWPLAPGAAEEWADPFTEVLLHETGPNTAVFESLSQLLTSNDFELPDPDDEMFVFGHGGYSADEATGDRTHRLGDVGRSFIRGGVRAAYGTGPTGLTTTVPVCERSPDVRKFINVRVTVLREPFVDSGLIRGGALVPMTNSNGRFDFDNTNTATDIIGPTGPIPVHDAEEVSEPYLDISTGNNMLLPGGPPTMGRSGRGLVTEVPTTQRDIRRANGVWAPSCIELRQVGTVAEIDAPAAPSGPSGTTIMDDGVISVLTNEHRPLFAALNAIPGRAPLSPATLDVVYGPHDILYSRGAAGTGHAFAYTFAPFAYPEFMGADFILMRGFLRAGYENILAHELGHAATNTGDNQTFPWQVYPASVTFTDEAHQYRRYPALTRTLSTTAVSTANLSVQGNLITLNPF